MDFTATHRLGSRALLLFMTRHAKWPLIMLILVGIAWFFGRGIVPKHYVIYSDYILKLLAVISAALFLLTTFKAYVEYHSYEYRFERESFHIARGYIAREERGVVYHQIQTVTLKHGLTDRAIGVRHLVIVMNGNQYQPSEVVLPALDHRKAEIVQRELLRQARSHAPQYSENGAAPAQT